MKKAQLPQKHRNLVTTLAAGLLPLAVQASPSGLNNIPTADTAPHLVPVIQAFSTWGDDIDWNHWAGMKIGFGPWEDAAWGSRFEAGVDARYAPGSAGPAVFQVKYSLEPWQEKGPAIGIGSANLGLSSEARDRAGQPFTYGVLSHDFKYFRLHGGYGFQTDNDAAFLGIDRTFDVFSRPLTLRADATQIQDQDQWLTSVGVMYAFTDWLVFETWTSFPMETGDPTFTFKLNFVIDWKHND